MAFYWKTKTYQRLELGMWGVGMEIGSVKK